jgi:adenylyltransferase/sulfurtransferase
MSPEAAATGLSAEEVGRYQRHLALPGFGPAAQLRLKAGSVLVIGAGGLGCPALLYLAAAGVGRIVLVDPDRVEVSNLQRQILYTGADAGALKVEVAARRLRALNPGVTIDARPIRFDRAHALDLVRECDVVLDGSDNFATRYLVNDACGLVPRPLVYGAVQGFAGQVSVFHWRGGPTYRCLFPEPPPPGTVPNCAEGGVLGVLPGLIGTLQAAEVIKLLSGVGEPLSGRLLLWDGMAMTSSIVSLRPDPNRRRVVELPPEGYGETCDVAPAVAPAEAIEFPPEIDPEALRAAWPAEPRLQLIDVREAWERQLGAILPSVHLPLGRLQAGDGAALGSIAALDAGAPTVVYCAHGMRSLRGAHLLRERYGFTRASSLRGGYAAWAGE